MSAGLQGKTTNWEDDIAGSRAVEERQSQWGEIPGEIVSFDAAKQTATVKPLYKPKFNGAELEMPNLIEIPVRFQRAGKGSITYPIQPGDKVLLRPQMRSTENYHTGEGEDSSDARSFALSDMEAFLDGGDSLTDPIQNFDPDNLHIRADPEGKYGIKASPEGKIRIDGSEGNIYDLIATFMELVASDQLQINYGSSAGSGHQLQNRDELMDIAAKVRAMGL